MKRVLLEDGSAVDVAAHRAESTELLLLAYRYTPAEFVEETALSVTVKRLRSKLEADPSRPEYLKTVYGIGYTWAVKS